MDGRVRVFWWGTQSVTDHEGTSALLRERASGRDVRVVVVTWPGVLACSLFAARAGWRLTGGDPAVDGPVDVPRDYSAKAHRVSNLCASRRGCAPATSCVSALPRRRSTWNDPSESRSA